MMGWLKDKKIIMILILSLLLLGSNAISLKNTVFSEIAEEVQTRILLLEEIPDKGGR